MLLKSSDLPELPDITKELINKGNFRLHKIDDNYLLTMESTGNYFIISIRGKILRSIDKSEKPKVKFTEMIRFSDLPSAPTLNELISC